MTCFWAFNVRVRKRNGGPTSCQMQVQKKKGTKTGMHGMKEKKVYLPPLKTMLFGAFDYFL
jgi:hypothetical protein